jgi:hypothetical protein
MLGSKSLQYLGDDELEVFTRALPHAVLTGSLQQQHVDTMSVDHFFAR